MVHKNKKNDLLKGEEKVSLYEKMMTGQASAHELIRLSFLRGMITDEQYADFLEIDKHNCDVKILEN